MKKHIIFILSAIFLLGINSCRDKASEENTGNKKPFGDTVFLKRDFSLMDFLSEDSLLNKKVEIVLGQLNDTEKVAQMIFTSAGKNGKTFETVHRLISEKKAGGVIIMGGSKESFKNIITKLDSASNKNKSLPLLFAADAEPGFVESRIQNSLKFPPQSKIKTAKESGEIAEKISKILKELKVNINFAPVCDISENRDVIGDRSFGKDISRVTEFSMAFINATQKNNIIATAKHFPGHGNVFGDSHKELVYIDGDLKEIDIFKSVIKEGVTAIMIGHIAVRNNSEYQTNNLPASLSRKIVTDLLRNRLGFKGLIITDALNMGAVLKFDKPALTAAIAGCDILLMPTDESKLINALLKETEKNRELKKQIDESVKRIIKAKICLGLIK